MKKRICQMAALGSALLLAFSAPVQAAAVTANGTPAAVATNNVQNWPAGPETTSEAAVLIDADTGAVLYDKGMNEYRYPASTTKLMTILLATENSSPKDVVTFTETGIRDVTWDSSNINAQLGEQMTMKDCWFAAYIKSANEVCAQIAEYVGGTEANFVDMMNQRAKELGCTHTHFANASGLPDENHYSSPLDLARIMRYCIMNSKKQEDFLTITRTETYQFQDVEGKRSFSCYNHNAFLNMMDGALSGKTGFTSDAGYCYVGALRRDERTFIVALLACGWPNNKSYKWSDMRTLMTYALDHYQYKTFEIELPVRQIFINNGIKAHSDTIAYPGKNGTKISLTANLTPVSFLLKEDETISVDYEIPDQLDAPVRKGMQVGRIRCTLNDKLIREYPVYTTQNAEKRTFKKCVEYIFHLFSIQNSYQKAGNIKKDQAM